MKTLSNINLFDNLSQMKYNGVYYDFHNAFDFLRLELLYNKILILYFKNIKDKKLVNLKFYDVQIERMECFNVFGVNNLTIDNIYRGRKENNGKLIEFKDNKGYFYLEFYEGQKMEFWSSGFEINYP